jgi:hypothetical protein
MVLMELELHSTLRRPDAARLVIALVSRLITRQDYLFESMENLRDSEIAQ